MKSIILFKLKHSSKKKSSWCLEIFFLTSQGLLKKYYWEWKKKNCVNLTGLRYAQISGETFLGMCGRVFLEEISLWIGEMSKEDCPPNMSGNHPIPWEPAENRETGGRQIHSLCLSWEICLLLPWTSVISQAPWFSVGFPTQIMVYTIGHLLTPPLFPRLWTQTESQHTDFPGLPACRCQIMGLLSHCNHVSQIL